jgi:hypothetical protein
MTSGGARSRSGPQQDPNALRRQRKDDQAAWIELPPERTGAAPEWPLTTATPRELVLWERWWRKPEALLWEADGSTDYAALTCRMFAEAEVTKASAENRKTVRLMMADLYMTRESKERARIRVAADEVAEQRDERKQQKPAAKTTPRARDRMKVVKSG